MGFVLLGMVPMKRILIQLDTDPQPSVFDRVVAVDADVDEIFSYSGITPENVEGLVHGAIFTRKPADLKHTAIFVGGSNVAAGEAVFKKVRKSFYGPMKVSVMMDSNGSNTTASAAVLAAARHLDLKQTTAVVLGGTGPVGCRAAQLLLSEGATVRLASRTLEKAQSTAELLSAAVDTTLLQPVKVESPSEAQAACLGAHLVIAAGAAGVELLPAGTWRLLAGLEVLIDLNAVPPVGIEGVEIMDKGTERHDVICYGAIGVGGTKMKIHSAAIRKLFESNDQKLDTAAIYEIGRSLG